MKKIYSPKLLLMPLLLISISTVLNAQNFKLIDLDTIKSSTPSNYNYYASSNKDSFAVLNGIFYFRADDGMHGAELYSSDGTAEGTKLVKDINPGTASSNPFGIIVTADKLYFMASLETIISNSYGYQMEQRMEHSNYLI